MVFLSVKWLKLFVKNWLIKVITFFIKILFLETINCLKIGLFECKITNNF